MKGREVSKKEGNRKDTKNGEDKRRGMEELKKATGTKGECKREGQKGR